MSRSNSGLLVRRGVTAIVAATLVLAYAESAQASGAPALEPAPSSAASSASTCSPTCAAQQVLASAIQEQLRIGNSRLRVGVGSSKWTIGWSVAF